MSIPTVDQRVREYGFELRLCAHLETLTDGIIARQLGGGVLAGGRRILDIIAIEPGPEFETRRAITAETIPPAAIHSEVGVGRAVPWPRAIDASPESAKRILEAALAVGFFERILHEGEVRVRQTVRYPDWIGTITAIENKPDLSEPGGLTDQLRLDVALGLVDRVVLATESYVTAAHMNRLPDEVGVWRVHADEDIEIEEIREPTALTVDQWGIELGEREPLARQIDTVSPAKKYQARIRLAELAYGKGWRPAYPACTHIQVACADGTPTLPYCSWLDRVIDPADCGEACPEYTPGTPPTVDASAERDRRTGWRIDPPGTDRRQVSLTWFG